MRAAPWKSPGGVKLFKIPPLDSFNLHNIIASSPGLTPNRFDYSALMFQRDWTPPFLSTPSVELLEVWVDPGS